MKAKKLFAVTVAAIMCATIAPTIKPMPVSAAEAATDKQADGFKIYPELVKDGNDQYSNIRVSYFGKGADKLAKENGLTIAYRIKYKGKWFSWTPLDAYVSDQKDGKSTILQDYSSDAIQFCVTRQPYPKIPAYSKDLSQDGLHEDISEQITLNNPDENKEYVAPPYVISATPVFTSTFNVSKTKTARVTLKYDEQLQAVGTPDITVTSDPDTLNHEVSNVKFENGSENVTTGDINWTRDYSIVSFDMTLDDVYDAQFANFNFQITGLEGVNSHKAPNSFGYTTSFYDCKDQVAPFCYNWGSMDQVIYMSPSVQVADYAIDPSNYYYNQNAYDQFTTNIFVIAEKPDGTAGTFGLKYNQSQAVDKLRQNYQATLAVPYPKGFNARQDSDVTFRAYKFENKDGAVTAKELPTRITDKGLEVSQNTFGFGE